MPKTGKITQIKTCAQRGGKGEQREITKATAVLNSSTQTLLLLPILKQKPTKRSGHRAGLTRHYRLAAEKKSGSHTKTGANKTPRGDRSRRKTWEGL